MYLEEFLLNPSPDWRPVHRPYFSESGPDSPHQKTSRNSHRIHSPQGRGFLGKICLQVTASGRRAPSQTGTQLVSPTGNSFGRIRSFTKGAPFPGTENAYIQENIPSAETPSIPAGTQAATGRPQVVDQTHFCQNLPLAPARNPEPLQPVDLPPPGLSSAAKAEPIRQELSLWQ